jgi:hypothetical protein
MVTDTLLVQKIQLSIAAMKLIQNRLMHALGRLCWCGFKTGYVFLDHRFFYGMNRITQHHCLSVEQEQPELVGRISQSPIASCFCSHRVEDEMLELMALLVVVVVVVVAFWHCH